MEIREREHCILSCTSNTNKYLKAVCIRDFADVVWDDSSREEFYEGAITPTLR